MLAKFEGESHDTTVYFVEIFYDQCSLYGHIVWFGVIIHTIKVESQLMCVNTASIIDLHIDITEFEE